MNEQFILHFKSYEHEISNTNMKKVLYSNAVWEITIGLFLKIMKF